MPSAAHPAPAPRLSWRALVAIPVVAAGLSGLAVYLALGLVYDEPWRWHGLAGSVGRAAIYLGLMWPGLVVTFRWTTRRWPLRGPADVARHVAALVGVHVALFVVASGVVRIALGDVTPPVVFAVILAVATVSTAALATILYGALAWRRLRAAEAAALRAELRALRAQINPHFLFNALNTIAALVRIRPHEAEAVTEHLADLFRYSLSASERPTVTLADELGSAQTYLAIETARFGEGLRTEIDVPEALRRRAVPGLVLQPLVENAVKHGLRHAGDDGTVTVRAHDEDGVLVVSVLDTGPGFGTDHLADVLGRGTGLTNVHDRLRAECGPTAGLRLVPGGIALVIPA